MRPHPRVLSAPPLYGVNAPRREKKYTVTALFSPKCLEGAFPKVSLEFIRNSSAPASLGALYSVSGAYTEQGEEVEGCLAETRA
jgi:hypothetical protein